MADNSCCGAVEFLKVCGVAAVLKFGLCSFAFDRNHGERIGFNIFKGGVCCGTPAVSQLPGNENTSELLIFNFSSLALRNTCFTHFLHLDSELVFSITCRPRWPHESPSQELPHPRYSHRSVPGTPPCSLPKHCLRCWCCHHAVPRVPSGLSLGDKLHLLPAMASSSLRQGRGHRHV